MSFSPPSQISADGRKLVYISASLLGQTCLYGANLAFLPYAAGIIFRKRTGNALNTFMCYAPLFSFATSTLFWGVSLADFFIRLRDCFIDGVPLLERTATPIVADCVNMFNAVILINFILTDAIVLWRAWVICQSCPKAKPFLVAANVLLGLGFGSALTSIGLRILFIYGDYSGHFFPGAVRPLELIQVIALGFSLLINILATGSIGWRHWDLRKSITSLKLVEQAEQSGTVSRTLRTLIESGFLYGMATIIYLATSTIPLPGNQHLGTRLFGSYVQISSLYPALVMVIVHQRPEEARRATVVSQWDVKPASRLSLNMFGGDSFDGSTETGSTIRPHQQDLEMQSGGAR